MFINYTNHPQSKWSQEQLNAAKEYGDIIDLPFPNISPDCNEKLLKEKLAEEIKKIIKYEPKCVLCQGEMTFTCAMVKALSEKKIKTVCACSERRADETVNGDGKIIKTAIFVFKGFRNYF